MHKLEWCFGNANKMLLCQVLPTQSVHVGQRRHVLAA